MYTPFLRISPNLHIRVFAEAPSRVHSSSRFTFPEALVKQGCLYLAPQTRGLDVIILFGHVEGSATRDGPIIH